MTQLPDTSRSRAILVGAGRYRVLSALGSVQNNISALAAGLQDERIWGLPAGNCAVVEDPVSHTSVLDPIAEAAREATDTLVLYYAGHGLVDPRRGELHLALADSDPQRIYTAVSYSLIRDLLLDSRAMRRIVILDCCYSGRALGQMASAIDAVATEASAEGTYVLAAAAENKAAMAPPGAHFTAFTGELLEILEHGISSQGPLLDLDSIYRELLNVMREKGYPNPQKRDRNTAGQLALIRNQAHRPSVGAMLEPDAADRPAADECARMLVGPPVRSKVVSKQRLARTPTAGNERRVVSRSSAGTSSEFAFIPDGQTLEGLPDGVDFISMKFSPDGRYLAAGVNSNVHVWDTGTGRAVGSAMRTGMHFQEMTFSPDSRLLVVALNGQSVARWNLAGSTPMTASASILGGRNLAISPDGRLFAVCEDKNVLLMETEPGPGSPRAVQRRVSVPFREEKWREHPVFSFDSSRIAFALDGDAHVYDTATLREVMRPLRHRSGGVDRINFSPDGRFVVTRADNLSGRRSVTLWDLTAKRSAGWEIDASLELSSHTRLRFFADGNIVALADPGWEERAASVRFWNTSTRHPLGAITPGSSAGYVGGFMFADSVSISPGGQWVADIKGGKLCLWDLAKLRTVARSAEDPGGRVHLAAFAPDWRLMATCVRPLKGSMFIRIWRLSSEAP